MGASDDVDSEDGADGRLEEEDDDDDEELVLGEVQRAVAVNRSLTGPSMNPIMKKCSVSFFFLGQGFVLGYMNMGYRRRLAINSMREGKCCGQWSKQECRVEAEELRWVHQGVRVRVWRGWR